jgi:hypothetical protein
MKIKKSSYRDIMILYLEQQYNQFLGLNPDKLHKNFQCGNIKASFQKYSMTKL